MVNLRINQLEV